jgi:parallel beta-helix repeat protein
MLKMKKEMLVMSISLLLSFVSFSGCIEETSQVEEPKMVYIDDDYDNTISGWDVDHFDTIQDGIDKVSEGGTVYVSNGIYYENIVINKSITMIGEDKLTTIIENGEKGDVVNIAIDNCTIQNMNISNSGYDAGVKILSNRTTITNNILYGNYYGIWIGAKSNNIISNNIILNNEYGIKVDGSINTIITTNQILSNSLEGIILESSRNATISDNVLQNNGIRISGELFAWNTHVIKNNTANNKPIYYYKNENGVTVPNDAIQVILVNCSDFGIKNINFENIINGIQIGFSSNIRIENNNFISNKGSAILMHTTINSTILSNTINGGNGIDLSKSENNNILQNTIENAGLSIRMYESNHNNITANSIFSSSKYGMYLRSNSNNNEISKNKINNNYIGFRLNAKNNNVFKNEFKNNSNKGLYICCTSKDNVIYKNSFINNQEHIDYTIHSINHLYKEGFGNYWDDYLERYPNATQLNGVWDTPYQIPDSSFEDKYPLVEPVDI